MFCIWFTYAIATSSSLASVKSRMVQNGSAFLVPAYPGCPEKEAIISTTLSISIVIIHGILTDHLPRPSVG